jgi:hypothetical protein
MASIVQNRIYLLTGLIASFLFFAALYIQHHPGSVITSVFRDDSEVSLTRSIYVWTETPY